MTSSSFQINTNRSESGVQIKGKSQVSGVRESNEVEAELGPRLKTVQRRLTGERAAFFCKHHDFDSVTFADGESPLKHASDIRLNQSGFQWKYPLWYCKDISLKDCRLFTMARAGIWYTQNISLEDTTIQAPKTFRRSSGIVMRDVTMPNADETLWNCSDIDMEHVSAQGDYFAMNSHGIRARDFSLDGNYSFDGASDINIDHARILSKDAFWNSENVTVRNSTISGEYLGWNSKNLTFENCQIESLQGMCYIDNLVLRNCRLINTTLAFEYSNVDVEARGYVDSILNPQFGTIRADGFGKIALEPERVDPEKTIIEENSATSRTR
ncbi:DUF3737 family protein [Bifidobacterium asteroides]|uniref:DUF3737 family protein n=1 Tax=Bifidobacterium asteroides TaxID=1684 RepID=UPI003A8009D5